MLFGGINFLAATVSPCIIITLEDVHNDLALSLMEIKPKQEFSLGKPSFLTLGLNMAHSWDILWLLAIGLFSMDLKLTHFRFGFSLNEVTH